MDRPKLLELLTLFSRRKCEEYEDTLTQVDELDEQHRAKTINANDYRIQHEALINHAETLAEHALKTRTATRSLEEQLREMLIESASPQSPLAVESDETMTTLETILRSNPPPRIHAVEAKWKTKFFEHVVHTYRTRITLPECSEPPPRGWIPDSHFQDATDGETLLLDQLTGLWLTESMMGSTYRVMYLISPAMAGAELEALCGIDAAAVSSVRNAVVTHESMAYSFEAGQLVLVPASFDEPLRWKIAVVDMYFERHHNWEGLHGREVVFPNAARPSTTVCYYRYLVTMLRSEGRRRGGEFQYSGLEDVPFDSPVPLVERSVVRAFVRHLGGVGDWEKLERLQGGLFYDETEDKRLASLQGARLAKMQKVWEGWVWERGLDDMSDEDD